MKSPEGKACVAAAEAAAEVIQAAHESRASRPFEVDYKGRINIVTEVDHAAEERVVEVLRARLPDVPILAEERGEIGGTRTGCRFVVDPLDGTTNFAHGFPAWAVSVAYEKEGRIVAGAVLDPNRKELFTAESGKGARLNGHLIGVSPTPRIDQALLATGFPYPREAIERALRLFVGLIREARGVRRAGSAALDLCSVAAGRFDAFWEETLMAWDTAAGELMVREAGGQVTDYEGAPFRNGGPNILATNGVLHPAMLDLIAAHRDAPLPD